MLGQKALRISHVGLRGVVGKGLQASHVIDFASAFGSFLERGRPVLIGRDPRASGTMLREGVVSGLMACGHQVIDLGVVSTPVLQHAIRRLGGAGGVSIGASHNDARWNALKFFGARGTYLSTAQAGELLDIYHLRHFEYTDWLNVGSLTCDDTAIDHYIDELEKAFDFEAARRFRVVVDCCNGTSSLILRRLNERCQFNFILINERLEGVQFSHDPMISARTIGMQLAPLIQPLGADVGFCFDVDSDRVGVATEAGHPVSEEIVLPLIADWRLSQGQGSLVITNLSTTALLDEIVRRHGGKLERVPVGRQAATDALGGHPPDQIAVAGEGTGAVMMPQFEFIYDGIAAMFAVLALLHERGQPLSRVIDSYPRFHMIKWETPLRSPRLPELLMELQERYSDGVANVVDGLRIDWPDRWFHIRASQTEPVVRIICEQRDQPPTALFQDLQTAVRSL